MGGGEDLTKQAKPPCLERAALSPAWSGSTHRSEPIRSEPSRASEGGQAAEGGRIQRVSCRGSGRCGGGDWGQGFGRDWATEQRERHARAAFQKDRPASTCLAGGLVLAARERGGFSALQLSTVTPPALRQQTARAGGSRPPAPPTSRGCWAEQRRQRRAPHHEGTLLAAAHDRPAAVDDPGGALPEYLLSSTACPRLLGAPAGTGSRLSQLLPAHRTRATLLLRSPSIRYVSPCLGHTRPSFCFARSRRL